MLTDACSIWDVAPGFFFVLVWFFGGWGWTGTSTPSPVVFPMSVIKLPSVLPPVCLSLTRHFYNRAADYRILYICGENFRRLEEASDNLFKHYSNYHWDLTSFFDVNIHWNLEVIRGLVVQTDRMIEHCQCVLVYSVFVCLCFTVNSSRMFQMIVNIPLN